METVHADEPSIDIDGQMAAYMDRLKAWPITDIERVLSEWPRRNKFWPAWAELEAELPDLAPQRLTYAPEHKPLRSRAEEIADMHKPFTRAEWLDFCAAMRGLRDPTVPHMAREVLLRIGAGIEARQRPHAERMGWA
jgi:hypothetical protein